MGKWLAALAWPMVSRVLAALGIGTVTYVGLNSAINAALGAAKAALGTLGGEVSQLMAMAGFFQAMAIIAGGMLAGVTFMTLKKFALKAVGA